MNAKQMRAVLLTVEGGLTQKQIAEELKVTEQTLVNWKKKQEYKDELLNAEREMLKGLTVKAVKTMENLLTAKSELVRYNAASDILDRTGHKPTDKVEAEVITPTFINDVPAND
ncbi:phBC6A51 family helix-turn-helix protein [Staphylococcus haemolyticus]|uniref:phBC6A51 family helix-turn-helix protein n=1 Tax=Staphylococcus haemolyticus TaxID=1283 RepID=UPI0021B33AF9|nr:phBC6A51 family helix-turn-helix protein [Staphylococcus haemolyticus]